MELFFHLFWIIHWWENIFLLTLVENQFSISENLNVRESPPYFGVTPIKPTLAKKRGKSAWGTTIRPDTSQMMWSCSSPCPWKYHVLSYSLWKYITDNISVIKLWYTLFLNECLAYFWAKDVPGVKKPKSIFDPLNFKVNSTPFFSIKSSYTRHPWTIEILGDWTLVSYASLYVVRS